MKKLAIGTLIILAFTTWIYPQANADQGLKRYLFSPDFLRLHQRELQLSQEQRRYIVQQINEIQAKFTPLQWGLEDEVRKLIDIVEHRASEEEAVLQQLDVVLSLEKEIKSQQLILAVRIRNTLSEEQLRKVRIIRARTLAEQRTAKRNPDRNPNRVP
jgi:hypothetical protein